MSVRRIAGWYRQGLGPAEIARNYGHLNLAQIHAALAYYHANQHEIDQDLENENELYESLVRQSSNNRVK